MPDVTEKELCVVCQTSDDAELAAGRPPRGCLWVRQKEGDADVTEPAHVLEQQAAEINYEAMQRSCPPYLQSLAPDPIDPVTS